VDCNSIAQLINAKHRNVSKVITGFLCDEQMQEQRKKKQRIGLLNGPNVPVP